TDAPSAEARDPLTAAELRWLDDVAVLITAEERSTYLLLPRSYQRAGFVEAFWKARDRNPRTPENETRSIFEARVEIARKRWGSLQPDQARVYLLNGEAINVLKPACDDLFWPLEVWRYAYSDRSRRPFGLLFYQTGAVGPFRLWHPDEGYKALINEVPTTLLGEPVPRPGMGYQGDFGPFYHLIKGCADGDLLVSTMRSLEQGDRMLAEVVEQARPTDVEWLETFRTFS